MKDEQSTNYIWHHKVHERLGESLHYFFVYVRPLDPEAVVKALLRMIEDKDLGGVIAYPVFGRYDLVVRAWIHSNLLADFRQWLEQYIPSHRGVERFSVDRIERIKYADSLSAQLAQGMILDPDEEKIQSVQERSDPVQTQNYLASGLLIPREFSPPTSIKFYVSIRFDDIPVPYRERFTERLCNFMSDQAKEFFAVCIYTGVGNISILVKAETNDFFKIASIPSWIGKDDAAAGGVRTETYLVGVPEDVGISCLIGDGRIGEATLRKVRGRDLFFESIVRGIYDSRGVSRVKLRVLEELYSVELRSFISESNKEFFGAYARGLIEQDVGVISGLLVSKYMDIEGRLRHSLLPFIERTVVSKSDRAALLELLPKDRTKKIPLGDLLDLYSEALTRAQHPSAPGLKGHWEQFVGLRNTVAHGDLDVDSTDLRHPIRIVAAQLPRLALLFEIIAQALGSAKESRQVLPKGQRPASGE